MSSRQPQSITSGWLNVKNLYVKYLVLHVAQLYNIGESGFSGKTFSKLEFLGIYNVPLMTLRRSAFYGLRMLRKLSLKHIRLLYVYNNVLEKMPKLEEFSLDSAGKMQLNLTHFFGGRPLNSLNRISIRNCNLSNAITETSFSALQNITELQLISNQIKTIGPKSFDSISLTLERLILRMNHLTSISADLFVKIHDIWIDFTGNPWHCGCDDMENFRILAQTMDTDKLNGLICNTPSEYHGIALRNCPPLCKANNENEEHENEGHENEEHEIERFNEKIDIKCEISNSYQMVNLTQSSHKIGPVSRNNKDELYIDTELLSNHFKLIEFDQNSFNNENTCNAYIKGNRTKNVKFKQKLDTNILYRVCWMHEDFETIFPLDCVTFHSNSHKEGALHFQSEGEDLDAWIMEPNKPIMIIVCVLFAIFAPVLGIVIAVILAKISPKWVRGQKPSTGKDVVAISKDQQSINRQKYVSVAHYSLTFRFFIKKN